MKIDSVTYLIVILQFVFASITYSQPTTKIKVKKQNHIVYFFQKDTKTDTILKHKNNLFYFILNDTLKQSTQILIDNGKFISTKNDSIIEFVFMPGLKYEAKFNIKDTLNKKQFQFLSLINGATNNNKNEVTIKIISAYNNTPLFENTFYYKN